MFMDVVVFSGLGVVAMTVAFFGGVYYFLKKDSEKHSGDSK